MQLEDKRVTRQLQYVALSDRIPEVIVLDEECLLQDLHRVLGSLGVVLALHLEDFSEGALPENVQQLEGAVAEANVIEQFRVVLL